MQKVRIIRSKRKTLSIEVHPDGEVLIRAPLRLPKKMIDRVLEEKHDWVRRKLADFENQRAGQPLRNFNPGETFPFLGQRYPLHLRDRARPALALENGCFLLARGALEQAEEVFERWYRAEAQRVFAERLAYYSALTGLQPERLRLSSARTRWGSCSTSGTLSLNWRLILAPPTILDYVILHELAHMKIKNHQRAFWELVEKMLPDYAARRKWLKDYGHQLVIR
jgi:predicted metal-dependent hydrolase